MQIFVLTQGFIRAAERAEFTGSEWVLYGARQVTRWKGGCGIFGVAKLGPREAKATLHPPLSEPGVTCYVPLGALVERIDCDEAAWTHD